MIPLSTESDMQWIGLPMYWPDVIWKTKMCKVLLCVCHYYHLLLIIILTHKGNGSEEDDDGASVVESEDMVVDAHRVPLVEQAGDPPEDEGEHAGTQILYLVMDWSVGLGEKSKIKIKTWALGF